MFLAAVASDMTPREGGLSSKNDFIEGFVNGTKVFSAIPSYEKCDPVNDRVKANATQFLELIQKLSLENYQQVLNQLIAVGQDILIETTTNLPKCVSAIAETHNLTKNLINHVSKEGYLNRTILHAFSNFPEVFTRFEKIQKLLNDSLHFETGIESGSLFNFVFLHDFVNPTNSPLVFLFSNTEGNETLKDFVSGFINGTGISSLVPSIETCDIDASDKIVELISKIKQSLANFTDLQTFAMDLVIITRELFIEVIEKCGQAAEEMQIASHKILDHVTQTDFKKKVLIHAYNNIFELSSRISQIISHIKEGAKFNAGHESGKLVNFVGFWDFKA